MVAAGIYLVARLYPAFDAAPTTLAVMAVIAAITMLGSALAAFAQRDIKRVLAYSTISQLAYMLAALAAGSVPAATFHLLSHAAFKALLFLAAGSVIHAMGTNQMADMGGLRRAMPVTFATMTLGLAALAGVPPLSGFFSKESVIGATEHAAQGDASVAPWAGWLLLVTALLTVAVTAAYVTRAWLMTFFDTPRGTRAPHEAPVLMRWPLVVLAVPTVLLGAVIGPLPGWLGAAPLPSLDLSAVTVALGLVALVAGALGTLVLWRRAPAGDPADMLGRARPWFDDAFKVDAFYDRVLVRPVRALASGVRWGDEEVVDSYVQGSGSGARFAGGLLRLAQNGNVQGYLTLLLAGVLVMALGASLT
jgi:NADH-quinone oxidoreductase subunit L